MRRWMVMATLAVVAAVGLFLVLAGDPSAALSRAASSDLSSDWHSSGPTGADSQPLAIHHLEASGSYAADGTLFAAASTAIYRSQDWGQSWQSVLDLPNRGTAAASVAQVAFSHVRLSPNFIADGTLFALLQDSDGSATLYKSAERGNTWGVTTVFSETVVALRLSTDFPSDNTLFVLTGDGTTLRKSTDGGQNWSHLPFNVANPPNGFDLGIVPDFAQQQTLFVSGIGQTLRSVDGGNSWTTLPNAGPNYGIAISPNFVADHTLWQSFRSIEGAGDGSPEADVIRSTDSGSTWFYSTAGLPGVYEPFPRHLAVSPRYAQDSTLFTGLSGQFATSPSHALFCSYDGGGSAGTI